MAAAPAPDEHNNMVMEGGAESVGVDPVSPADIQTARTFFTNMPGSESARTLFDDLVINGQFLVRPNLDGDEHKYQQASVVHTLAYFGANAHQANEERLPAAVSIPTGAGKSRIIWALAAAFSLYEGAPAGKQGRTLVITPSIRIRDGASDTWQQLQNAGVLGEGTGGIVHLVPSTTFQATEVRPAHWVSGILQDSGTPTPTTAFRDAKVVVCTWQTLNKVLEKAKERFPAEGALDGFFASCGFANFIVDEAHHHSANSYQNLVKTLQPDRTVLLSACFERLDGKLIKRHTVFSRPLTWAETNRLVKHTTRHALVFGDTVTIDNVEVKKDQDPVSYTCGELERADDIAAGDNEDDDDDPDEHEGEDEEDDGDDAGMPTVPKAVRDRLRRAIENNTTIQRRLAMTTVRAILDKKRDTGCPIAGLCFCRDQRHAMQVCSLIRSLRIPAPDAAPTYLEVDYMSSDRGAENDDVIRRLENGELDIVCVVAMLGEGYDYPLFGVATFFTALGSKARSKAYQAAGRILRIIPRSRVPGTVTALQLRRAQNADIFYLKCSCMSRLLMDIGIDNSDEVVDNVGGAPDGGPVGNRRPASQRRRLNDGTVVAAYAEEYIEHHARVGGPEGGIAAGVRDPTNPQHDLIFDEARYDQLFAEARARRTQQRGENQVELQNNIAAQIRAQEGLNEQQRATAQQLQSSVAQQATLQSDLSSALAQLLGPGMRERRRVLNEESVEDNARGPRNREDEGTAEET